MRFSANLGFLFTDRPLPDAVVAAAEADFEAVECHWPYDTPANDLARACRSAGVRLVSINTRPGDTAAGDFGLSALPGREAEAREAIDEAIDYARDAEAGAVHVMASKNGCGRVFDVNLRYATDRAGKCGLTVLIEPMNRRDAPGYLLDGTDAAVAVQDRLGADNLKILFDCYHVQIIEGDLLRRASRIMDRIGHIQFAGVPDRGEPDSGEVNYPWLLPALRSAGYRGFFGAEYRPTGQGTSATFGWLSRFGSRNTNSHDTSRAPVSAR